MSSDHVRMMRRQLWESGESMARMMHPQIPGGMVVRVIGTVDDGKKAKVQLPGGKTITTKIGNLFKHKRLPDGDKL